MFLPGWDRNFDSAKQNTLLSGILKTPMNSIKLRFQKLIVMSAFAAHIYGEVREGLRMRTASLRRIALLVQPVFLLATSICFGENYFGPTTSSNRFLLGPNEVFLIDSVIGQAVGGGPFVRGSFVRSNITYGVLLKPSDMPNSYSTLACALPGPGELIIPYANMMISGVRITNVTVGFLAWEKGSTNEVTIDVPPGKTLQFFQTLLNYNFTSWPARFAFEGNTASGNLSFGQPIRGPIQITFAYPGIPYTAIGFAAYWFVEDVLQNPSSILPVGGGGAGIQLESSGDLKSWHVIATCRPSFGTNSFYRLRLTP